MYLNFLTKIKNARAAGRKTLRTGYGRMELAIAEELCQAGFLDKIELKGKPLKKELEIFLKGKRPIRGFKFFSKPSVKNYCGYRKLPSIKSGYGLLILSTSKGIKNGEMAKKEKVGGQLLFGVW
ncbi:30S ribosomal protein S8 [Candidatus Jorgensenbacteria bacterium CG_4_8_14_3_um_filter_38_10]|uniref:Small ribosomal subunit protein uS8 n=1 Tax=Candidatus Jorgensenbacteria bacterium CG11_big_fil_rev_8_21_14_0_20_38_23 TaxID=1974594 RepID=A0A2H0NFE1_9BACT|nr:MAG: 30S ribosomal protein S8 [Candidatus Jorgensenbacteria bacterium CG11_big_fil_rev_8_21_14_0_20_38_23]PIV13194.1 MAG: 30S ribosomal protein S8 [Candidatus Jorgensenbacteria bacterium CG03_land_8_20_14_0_80_38_39]PIW97593.1 MAG: 30S ribosomal protein S8 [Candidatus Jorgensenbacteria bacterium CG_4_8_14_3_um_filter_38_10]